MKIYYHDTDIVVCEKEYGISSQKSDKANMIDILSEHYNTEVYPVHRLDITTSGVMVYALNQKSAAALSADIANHSFEKIYLAIVHGECEPSGEMKDLLYHDRIKNKSFVVKTKRAGAKEASLDFERLSYDSSNDLSLVKIALHTGRTHQIRVQFASRGHMLLGDGKYGAKDNSKIALHSHIISFIHPQTKKKMSFSSTPAWIFE
ncbi:MAG: RluA family pseudouridine synthase [Clostridia bacterium]|nr:RluA family pseudouridine synthase [Clostridia bacterium]